MMHNWFISNKHIWLNLANNRLFRSITGLFNDESEIVDIFSNGFAVTASPSTTECTFYTHDKIVNTIREKFFPFLIMIHAWDYFVNLFKLKKLNMGFDDFFPQPDPASTACDGHLDSVQGSWATARGTAEGGSTSATTLPIGYALTTAPNWMNIWRAVINFDTSSLSGKTVLDATVTMTMGVSPGSTTLNISPTDSEQSIYLVKNTVTDPSDFTTSDWPDFIFSSISSDSYRIEDLLASTAYTYDLSNTSDVNTTGVTQLGLLTGADMNDSEPSRSGNSGNYLALFSSVEETGTTSDPKLSVTVATDSKSYGQQID